MKTYCLFLFIFLSPYFLSAQLTPNSLLLEGNFNFQLRQTKSQSNFFDGAGRPVYIPSSFYLINAHPAIGWTKNGRLYYGFGLEMNTQKSIEKLEGTYFNSFGNEGEVLLKNSNVRRTLRPTFYGRYFVPLTSKLYFAPKASLQVGWERVKFEAIFSIDGQNPEPQKNTFDEFSGNFLLQPSMVYQINERWGLQAYFGQINFLIHPNFENDDLKPALEFNANLTTTSFQLGFFYLLRHKKEKAADTSN